MRSEFTIVESLCDLSELTRIKGFYHFLVHSPSEIIEGRSSGANDKYCSCSPAVRKILGRIPADKVGYVVVADWKGYYKSIGRKPNTKSITAAYIYNPGETDGALESELLLMDEATSQWGERVPKMVMRLAISCLKPGFVNAGAAIVGLETDIRKVIDEGKKILDTNEVQEVDRAFMMHPLKISAMPLKSEERSFCDYIRDLIVAAGSRSDDVKSVKLAFHFESLTRSRKSWWNKLEKYAEFREQTVGDLCILICVQKYDTEFVVDLPGGKRELGEGTISALLREVQEESGVILNSFDVIGDVAIDESATVPLQKQSSIFNFRVEKGFQSYMIGIERLDL